MIYCDTSLLVPALVTEANSDGVDEWLRSHDLIALAISPWTHTEVASALAMKQRRGILDTRQRATAIATWQEWASTRFVSVPCLERHFARAVNLVDVAPRGLRTGDALHLAIALDHRCELATFDRDLADAARHHGITVHPAAT